MPAMLRSNKKAIKIVRSILGLPTSFQDKKRPYQRKLDRELIYHETLRAR
jgi:hypothetical protein